MDGDLCKAANVLLLFAYVSVAAGAMWPLKESGVPVISLIYLAFVAASLFLYRMREWRVEGAVLFLISVIPIVGVPAVTLADPTPRRLAVLLLFVALGAANTVAHRTTQKKRR